MRTSNPFISNRVTQADTEGVDVSAIHDKGFKQLVKRISGVRDRGDTSGVLLIGAAGVGKSHVLARLFRWAHDQSAATVVYLHDLLASPERLPRYLLGAVMSSLAGSRPYAYPQSELYALIKSSHRERTRKEQIQRDTEPIAAHGDAQKDRQGPGSRRIGNASVYCIPGAGRGCG